MKNLKQRLKQGQTLNGCWLNLGSSLTAEIIGLAGFDWVLIDLEHGAGTENDVLHQLQALEHTPAAAIVRVESSERQRIHRVLDMGAEGIMCPRINNVTEAKMVAAGLSYPPDGHRGAARIIRATGFGRSSSNYYTQAADTIVGIVQIETLDVLDHLDAIAALPRIDVLFIGPGDLSMVLGVYGDFEHRLFKDAVKATIHAAEQAGKVAGFLLSDPDDFATYHEMGIRMIACGADAAFVSEGARNLADKLDARRGACVAGKMP